MLYRHPPFINVVQIRRFSYKIIFMFYYSNMETNGPKLIDADTLRKIYEDSLQSRKCIEEENELPRGRAIAVSFKAAPLVWGS